LMASESTYSAMSRCQRQGDQRHGKDVKARKLNLRRQSKNVKMIQK
jgi:hypothetical protein